METIQWHNYIIVFFAGIVAASLIHHFIQMVSANRVSTPGGKSLRITNAYY
jgi:hypothetical protein